MLRLKEQNNKLLTKVIFDLKLLREFGLNLLEQDRVKKLNDDIFELRTKQGSNINRGSFRSQTGGASDLAAQLRENDR